MVAAKPQQYSNTWDGVLKAAKEAQARYPELVAAQWALESGWGKHVSGKHNYFGLKGAGTNTETQEFIEGKFVTIEDSFINFDSLYDCVVYLVNRWYKNWKQYKGVNNATTREAAASQLVEQGYATDPDYANKLIKVIKNKIPANNSTDVQVSTVATVVRIQAIQATVLKKKAEQAAELEATERLQVPKGKEYGVVELVEMPADSHARVELAAEVGTWYVWMPHWKLVHVNEEAAEAKLDWDNFASLVTPNLTVGEILQWDKRRTPAATSVDRVRLIRTAQEFQRVRTAWGRPLGLTSFYRPEPINSQVGGVRNSRHVSGEAFDIYPVGALLDGFYQWIRPRWSGGLGDGRNKGFIHLDTRNNGHFVPGAGVKPYTEWLY